MELNENNLDILKAIEYITNIRNELIDDYLEIIKISDNNNYSKIIKYREHIDKYNKQIRMLEDCLIITRIINSGHFEEF